MGCMKVVGRSHGRAAGLKLPFVDVKGGTGPGGGMVCSAAGLKPRQDRWTNAASQLRRAAPRRGLET